MRSKGEKIIVRRRRLPPLPSGRGAGRGEVSAWSSGAGGSSPSPSHCFAMGPFLSPRGEVSLGRADALRSPGELRQCRLGGDLRSLASLAVLQLDRAGSDAARADDELPRQADEIHGGELRARRFVAVVVERLDAGLEQAAIELVRSGNAARIAGAQIDKTDAERRDTLGPDDALIVMARFNDRADEPGDADTVGSPLDRNALAARSDDDGAHRLRVLGAEIEDVADLDPARRDEPVAQLCRHFGIALLVGRGVHAG